MISTIVLNWNRQYLLEKCVESYFATVGKNAELVIVDNFSSDGSVEYLKKLEVESLVKVFYLDQNYGGEAFNDALATVRGDLIHLSENDQIFLPGWFEHVEASFAAFEDLGQLSLFSSTPTDDEAWVAKPSRLRFSNRKILYEAHNNLGMSSIIRGRLFREHRLRVSNRVHGLFKFPGDVRLSSDIKAAGFWCAWSDRYYVRNVGHEVTEFERDPDYYAQNYASKPALGRVGWQARIESQKKLPRPNRSSLIFPDRVAVPEKTMVPVNGSPSRLWSMFDGFTAEIEVLELLFALTRAVKPTLVIETGTWLGLSACAIGRALLENGFGRLTTLEVEPQAHQMALDNISSYHLNSVIDARLISSLEFVPDNVYDMAIFDSDARIRGLEFHRFKSSLKTGAIVIFHDTAPHHAVVIEAVNALIAEGSVVGIELPTPRGVFIGRTI